MTEGMNRALTHLASKGFAPRIVLDVGAAKGWWSLACTSVFPQAKYFLIDPLAESEEHLRKLCADDPRFHCVLTALGSQPGEHIMNVTADCDGSSLLSWEGEDPTRQRLVPVTTADRLLHVGDIMAPDLIKIDVQGYELEVLRGAEHTVQHADVIIAEVSLYAFGRGWPRVHEVVAYLAERGFYVFDLADTLRRPYHNDLAQMDLVFVSRRSPLMRSNRWA